MTEPILASRPCASIAPILTIRSGTHAGKRSADHHAGVAGGGRRHDLHPRGRPHPTPAGRALRRGLPADRLPPRAGRGAHGGGVGAHHRQAGRGCGHDPRPRERAPRPHQRHVHGEPHPEHRRLLRPAELPPRHHAGDRPDRHRAHRHQGRVARARPAPHPRPDVDGHPHGVRGQARPRSPDRPRRRAERRRRRGGGALLRCGVVPAHAAHRRLARSGRAGSAPAAQRRAPHHRREHAVGLRRLGRCLRAAHRDDEDTAADGGGRARHRAGRSSVLLRLLRPQSAHRREPDPRGGRRPLPRQAARFHHWVRFRAHHPERRDSHPGGAGSDTGRAQPGRRPRARRRCRPHRGATGGRGREERLAGASVGGALPQVGGGAQGVSRTIRYG